MFSNKWYSFPLQFFLLTSSAPALGSHNNFASYGFFNIGPSVNFSPWKPLVEKLAWQGDRVFVGAGALYNPFQWNGWLIAPELIGQYSLAKKEGVVFIGPKFSLPVADGVHYFASGALGPTWGRDMVIQEKSADQPSDKEHPSWQLSSLIRVGRVQHMRNGTHFTVQLNYVRPSASDTKEHYISITVGSEFNLY